jgi:hypothetical protein
MILIDNATLKLATLEAIIIFTFGFLQLLFRSVVFQMIIPSEYRIWYEYVIVEFADSFKQISGMSLGDRSVIYMTVFFTYSENLAKLGCKRANIMSLSTSSYHGGCRWTLQYLF